MMENASLIRKLLALVVVWLLSCTLPVKGQLLPPNHVIVIDHSGSMKRDPDEDGVELREIAKFTALELFKASQQRFSAGRTAVLVFGHREPNGLSPYSREQQRSSCRDVQVLSGLVPNTPSDLAPLRRSVNSLEKAQGQTPISKAIQTAASLLKDGGGQITVITDMDQHVCVPKAIKCESLIRERSILARDGIYVRHIVAVEVDNTSNKTVRNFSNCLNAQLHSVKTIDDARTKSQTIIDDISRNSYVGDVLLGFRFSSPPILPTSPIKAQLLTLKDKNGQEIARRRASAGKYFKANASRGRVTAAIDEALLKGSRTVEVRPHQTTDAVIEIDPWQITLEAIDSDGTLISPEQKLSWRLSDERTSLDIGAANPLSVTLLPGKYKIEASTERMTGRTSFSITTGSARKQLIKVSMGLGSAEGERSPTKDQEATLVDIRVLSEGKLSNSIQTPGFKVFLLPQHPSAQATFNFEAPSQGNTLEPGDYKILVEQQNGTKIDIGTISISEGDRVGLDLIW